MDITNMFSFCDYVTSCSDHTLLGMAIECYGGVRDGRFDPKVAEFCSQTFEDILRHNEHAVGINIVMDMCMTVSFELMKRVAEGKFSAEEYATYCRTVTKLEKLQAECEEVLFSDKEE